MSQHNGQASSTCCTYQDRKQLFVLRQQNKRSTIDIKPIEITQLWNTDELILLLNTALPLKNPFFSIEQQPLFLLTNRTLQITQTTFFNIE